ncbi:Chitin synthase export chaperone [Abortiporus biennis]
MTRFGDFEPLCRNTPSYQWCNLFFKQALRTASQILTGASSDVATAPVGINPVCGISFVGTNGSLANIGNIVACALSLIFVAFLIWRSSMRRAAVGRVEFLYFLLLYFVSLILNLITTGSFLHQGSTALVVLTAIHAGIVAALFWTLVGNALVSTQIVEDGTLSSLIPFTFFTLAFFAATTYISLDVAFGFTTVFGPSNPPADLHSIPLFVLTNIWEGAAAIIYLALMLYIILFMLNEVKPAYFYLLAAVLFILAQLDGFLLSKVICEGVSHKLDGTFVATVLETACVGVLYLGWKSITEESWDDDYYRR